jgi:hypothetical protein
MISIVQNFICTKEERLKILENNLPLIGEVFSEYPFYVNYNTDVNFDMVYSLYQKNIKKLYFYNDLTPEWAPTTLALVNQVETPYTIYLCEDTMIHSSKSKIDNCINEYIENNYDYLLLTKIDKYLAKEYIDGYAPWSLEKSPGYKKLNNGYFYLGKHSPHKRVSTDAVYRTQWFKERIYEFILYGDQCKHDIPIRDKRKPNFYEGYYDFLNGMARFAELKCYIPDEPIITEFENVKQNR